MPAPETVVTAEYVRDWISSRPDFPSEFDDSMIERFIFVCDNDIVRLKAVMELFFKFRNEFVEFFTDRDPNNKAVSDMYEVVDVLPLPKKTADGCQVYVNRLCDTDPDKFDFMAYSKMFFNISDVRMKTEDKIPTGDIPIFDMSGFTLKHMMKLMLSLALLKKYMRITQEAHPVYLKEIHVINTIPLLEKMLTFLRPIMKDEIKNMLHFHATNTNTIEKFIGKDVLPVEYGGTGASLKDIKSYWRQKITENREWLLQNPWRNNTTDSAKCNRNLQMDAGSFKTLAID